MILQKSTMEKIIKGIVRMILDEMIIFILAGRKIYLSLMRK